MCDKLAAAAAGNIATKTNILNAYRQQAAAQSGKVVTKAQATILTTLSQTL